MPFPPALKISVSSPSYFSGLLLVTGATLAWSTAGLFTRAIALDNWTLLWWRGVFGAIAIFIAICVASLGNGHQRAIQTTLKQFQNLGYPGWIFVFVSGLGMVMFITALNHTTVAHVSILYATVPLVTALIAWFFLHEKPTRYSLAASLMSLVGVCIMMGLSNEGHWAGDLLALGMTLCLAAMMVITRVYALF